MPEYLVITNRRNVLDVVDQIRSEDGIEIRVESDFTKGLKAIFYRLPDVVFIQEEIAGISAERVASQVRTLLDDEPIRLMLLHERMGEWDSGDPSFDGLVDTALPFDDLASRFREVLSTRRVDSAAFEAFAKDEDSSLGSAAETGSQDTGFEFDRFSDIFPAQIHHNWETFSTKTGQDAHENLELSRPPEEPFIVDYEFCFEPPGDIVSSIPLEKPEPPDPVKGISEADTKTSDDSKISPDQVDMQFVEKTRLAERESPHQLFASINEEDTCQQMESEHPSSSMSEKLRLKGVATQSTILKSGPLEAAVTASANTQSDGTDREASAKRALRGPSAKPSLKEKRLRDLRNDAFISGNIRGSEETPLLLPEKNRLARILKPGIFLLCVGIASFLILQNREYFTNYFMGEDEVAKKTEPLHRNAGLDLPAFIPMVPADSDYAADHPGWERYPGGGIDYLVYRERGRLLAIQIVALPEGKISDSFVRMCIRESTGLMDGDNWTTQKHDDFIVENSILHDRGEIAVYRKIPEREIRGIVLTFK